MEDLMGVQSKAYSEYFLAPLSWDSADEKQGPGTILFLVRLVEYFVSACMALNSWALFAFNCFQLFLASKINSSHIF